MFEYRGRDQRVPNVVVSVRFYPSVTEVGRYAFHHCSKLIEVVLNEGLTVIGDYAFYDCSSLQSVKLPSTIIKIGTFSFCSCNILREVVLNEGLKKICSNVFQNCTSLQSIRIPSTVDEIRPWAFRGCTELREIVLHNKEEQIGDEVFENCTSLEIFKFPSLSTRLNNIIQAGQRDIETKLDVISAVEWRSGELSIPPVRREREDDEGEMRILVKEDKEKLNKVEGLIVYYEMKEATTLFELALWKAKIDQADISNPANRAARRIEVPGPVKDTILQYLD